MHCYPSFRLRLPFPHPSGRGRCRQFALLLLLALLCGCCCDDFGEGLWPTGRNHFWQRSPKGQCPSVPRGSLPAPVGASVRAFQHAQTTKARADQFVIYERDWISIAEDPEDFSTELGAGGLRNFKQMIDALPTVAGPIVIEPTSHSKLDRKQRQELDERRFQQIVTQLYLEGIENPDTRVIIAYPRAEALRAEDATRIFTQGLSGGGGQDSNGMNGMGAGMWGGTGAGGLGGVGAMGSRTGGGVF